MTPTEAVIELQNTYDKELTQFQTARYVRFLGKFNLTYIEKIVEKAVEETKMMPRIAHLKSAAEDLLILKPDRKSKADKGCTVCSGTGWEYVTVNSAKTNHKDVKAAQRCSCKDDPGVDF